MDCFLPNQIHWSKVKLSRLRLKMTNCRTSPLQHLQARLASQKETSRMRIWARGQNTSRTNTAAAAPVTIFNEKFISWFPKLILRHRWQRPLLRWDCWEQSRAGEGRQKSPTRSQLSFELETGSRKFLRAVKKRDRLPRSYTSTALGGLRRWTSYMTMEIYLLSFQV